MVWRALKHKRERQTTRTSEKNISHQWVQILFRKFFDKMGGEKGVGLVVCLIMQWAGNAGNECSLSGGLNSISHPYNPCSITIYYS